MQTIKTYNDLVYAVARRARELANMKMDELRLVAGYDCDNETQARERNRYKSRGELIEEILTEEIVEANDQDLETPTSLPTHDQEPNHEPNQR